MDLTCQMRSLIKGIIAEGRVRPGSIFWTSPQRAKLYIDQKMAEPIGEPIKKELVAEQKKSSSSGAQPGPSTDSQKSPEPGMVRSSPALRQAPASRASKPKKPAARGKQSR